MINDELTRQIIQAFFEVSDELGSGFCWLVSALPRAEYYRYTRAYTRKKILFILCILFEIV